MHGGNQPELPMAWHRPVRICLGSGAIWLGTTTTASSAADPPDLPSGLPRVPVVTEVGNAGGPLGLPNQ